MLGYWKSLFKKKEKEKKERKKRGKKFECGARFESIRKYMYKLKIDSSGIELEKCN